MIKSVSKIILIFLLFFSFLISTSLEANSSKDYIKPSGSTRAPNPVCEIINLRNPQISLAKDNYWIYEGSAEWTQAGGETIKSDISLKMEVLDVISLPYVNDNNYDMVALVRGNPTSDIFKYMLAEEECNRSQRRPMFLDLYTIYSNDGIDFYISEGREGFDEAQKGVAPSGGELITKTKDLKVGSLFDCYDEGPKRNDTFYCWNISSKQLVNQKNLAGNLKTQNFYQYNFIFQTLPDEERYSFAPGLGITSSSYVHHGTVMEYNLTLTEYSISNTVKICPVVY